MKQNYKNIAIYDFMYCVLPNTRVRIRNEQYETLFEGLAMNFHRCENWKFLNKVDSKQIFQIETWDDLLVISVSGK